MIQPLFILLQNNSTSSGSVDPFQQPVEYAFNKIFGWVFDTFGTLLKRSLDTIFAVPTIDTPGGLFPVARPGTPSSSLDLNMIIEGNFIEYIAAKSHDLVWLGGGPDTGGITMVALLLFIGLYMLGGFTNLFSFSRNVGQNQQRYNAMKGLFMLMFWYPLYISLVGGVHGIIQAFSTTGQALGASLASGMAGVLGGGTVLAIFSGPVGIAALAIAFAPYIFLALVMQVRGFVIGGFLIFGPFLIAGKYANIPIVSRICNTILNKSVPVVLLPLPMGPIMFVFNEMLLSSGSTTIDTVFAANPLTGAFIFLLLGFTLAGSVWFTFKIVSPQMAQMGTTALSIGTTAAVLAGGGGPAAASSAMRGGPLTAGARFLGSKINQSPWPGDGNRD